MIIAADEYEIFKENLPLADDDIAEEYIVLIYLYTRLRPLKGKFKIDDNYLQSVCSIFSDAYFDNDISLDLLINSMYNYINTQSNKPTLATLDNDIESFLRSYSGV